ncbi:PQQ-binding-like beta-propeller repeat protein [Streptomyces sp. NPDC003036]|uniref:outer membrane protein assembly factor BamB family protein n=1 Tax=Streptomyces sp. NPDC003036 TaxID=3154442 RepID=UPI0033BAA9A0
MATRTTEDSVPGGWARVIALVAVIAVPLGLLGGLASWIASSLGYMPGDSMERVWNTPYDRPADTHGNAAWLVGDTVVRSRYDAVTAFDAGSGKRRWEYNPPRTADICATSRAAAGSVALIGLGDDDKGCATVAAIDLGNGRELWRTARGPADGRLGGGEDLLAVGGGLAVGLPGDRTVSAYDLRTGAPRWKAAVPKGCAPGGVDASAEQVLAILVCDEMKLAAYDPADGKARWTVPLGDRRPIGTDATVGFLAAEPAVLGVRMPESYGTGTNSFVSFGPDGRRRALIESVGDNAGIPVGLQGRVAVDGGKLFADVGGKVVAYDLASGDAVWRESVSGGITALHAGGGRVTVLTRERKGLDQLYVHDAATGERKDHRTFNRDADDGNAELAGLLRHKDLLIAVRRGKDVRPFSGYATW